MPESPSITFMPGCNPAIQGARLQLLDALYAYDGRHNPAHPLHAHYTGLWEQYVGATCEAA